MHTNSPASEAVYMAFMTVLILSGAGLQILALRADDAHRRTALVALAIVLAMAVTFSTPDHGVLSLPREPLISTFVFGCVAFLPLVVSSIIASMRQVLAPSVSTKGYGSILVLINLAQLAWFYFFVGLNL